MRKSWLRTVTLGVITSIITAIPVYAAQRIYFVYGPINLSVGVDSLETFAKDGTINKELEFYLGRVNKEEKAKFREILVEKKDIEPVLLSRILNTSLGENILHVIGQSIEIQGGRNGKYALRGALVQAALDEQGLSIINVLRHLPTNIQFNGEQMLAIAGEVEKAIDGTKFMIEEMQRLTEAEAAKEEPIEFAKLPDLRREGKLGVKRQTWELNDSQRNRKFRVELYQPERWREGQTPVIVMSHGLASNPEHFETMAQHLASYGYVIAIPQHPGSDDQQLKDLFSGYSRQVFQLEEFINRPLDISYVIDELQRRNQNEFEGQLDLNNVGLVGHSFGGYTVLAVAGASIDFEGLQKACDAELIEPNTSILLQCVALQLPKEEYDFRDERVKAVIAINPVNSRIFGQKSLSKINIPVLLASGSQDPATPAVPEQIRSFTWLTNPDRYLVMVEGQAHLDVSQLDAGLRELLDSIDELTLPAPSLLHSYGNALSLAFMELYINNNPDYRKYVSASYMEYISEQPFPIFLISSMSQDELKKSYDKIRFDR